MINIVNEGLTWSVARLSEACCMLCSRTMTPHIFVFTKKPMRQGREALLDYGLVSAHALPAVLMLHHSITLLCQA